MQILIILNFLTVFVAAVVLSWKRHFIFAGIAWLLTLLYGYGIYHAGLDVSDKLVYMLWCEERYSPAKAYPSVMGSYLALLLTNVAAILYPWLKRWAVFLWFGFLLLSSFIVGFYSPLGMIEGLYGICCAIMTIFALMTGMTYLGVCTLENIYIHSLLPTLFAIPAVIVSVKCYAKDSRCFVLPLLLSSIYFLLNIMMTFVVWQHYIGLPLKEAGQKCVQELLALSFHSWEVYVMLNIFVFVVAFLADGLGSWLLYRYAKSKEVL